MGRRESHSRGAMNPSHLSELGCLQDSASNGHHHHHQQHHHDEQLRGTDSADRRQRKADLGAAAAPVEVKKHQHKHNLKHRYEVMETLGKGTYGKVKKAVERTSMRTVAIKSIRKERITDDLDRIHIQREIEITSSLRHANIIRFHEVFESRDKIVIVMEYASRGELYDYIQERKRLPETEARSIFRQIASAVHYCHKNGVVHRDLKLENILLDQDLNVKLADFGLSNNFQTGSLLQTYCGSPLYAAPEIVKGLPYTGPEVGQSASWPETPVTGNVISAMFPEVLQQLLPSSGDAEGRRSRPSSVISEDSLFSSDSFDLLDLSTQSQPRIFSQGRRHSGGGSVVLRRGKDPDLWITAIVDINWECEAPFVIVFAPTST